MNLRNIVKRLIPSPLSFNYQVGVVESDKLKTSSATWYDDVHWIKCGKFAKDGWFADPFIYDVTDDRIIILAEEWYNPIGRGRLVKMIVRRSDYTLLDVLPILTLDTHLSFPNLYEEDGVQYVYPENYEGGALKIWVFDGIQMSDPKVLIPEPLIDSQLVKLDDSYFIMAVKYVTGSWDDTKDLRIYKANSLLGPYTHVQTIHNHKNEERGAGRIIMNDDLSFIRPAQCCEGSYGKETILYQMCFDGKQFAEKELGRIIPDRKSKYGTVLHTVNSKDGLTVIDGQYYMYPHWVRKLYQKLHPQL